MSQTVTIEEAASHLADLIAGLHPGEEITLTSGNRAIAKIVPAEVKPVRRPGAAKGMLHILKEDDEHLEDFKDYM
jgi:antitoxin (DNA-binding transcriptional repressor) of toxin-antitoxin stability system